MKSGTWAVMLVAAIAIVVGIEEWRISGLRGEIAKLSEQETAEPGARGTARHMPAGDSLAAKPSRSGRAPDAADDDDTPAPPDRDDGEESLNKTLRKMVDNPATKAMMNQGVKAMAGMWFKDLVKEFDLNDEEEDYFINLVAGGFAEQQTIGLKMMDTKTDEERKALKEEIETAKRETKESIKEFLNNEEDWQAYQDYEDRLPERQQLDGLRATMAQAGQPLSPEQEGQVVEAMYRARKSGTDSIDWEGSGGMEAMASGNAVELFERDWEANRKKTVDEVSTVLEGEQLDAFGNYLEQAKEMQLMGIRMAENMFSAAGDDDPTPLTPEPAQTPTPDN
jgi:hypothetical protein